MVQAPALLLLDEPTAWLDMAHQVTALERLEALYGLPLEAAQAPSGARLFAPRGHGLLTL